MRYHSWLIDEDSVTRRVDAIPYTPCGCVGNEERYHCMDMDKPDDEFGDDYSECLRCGAVWDATEGAAWERFGCDDWV